MTAVVHAAGILVRSLDVKSVVIGREMSVNGRSPFPLHRDARNVAAEVAVPHHRATDGPGKTGRKLKRQAVEEDFIATGDRNGGHPSVGNGVESRGSARGAW